MLLAVSTGGIAYCLRDADYWVVDNLGGNLAAGFVGTLAVLFFIEKAIEKKRQEERTRFARLAVRRIASSVQGFVNLFSTMIKASAPATICSLPPSLNDLFSAPVTANLDWLDLDGPTGNLEHQDWKT